MAFYHRHPGLFQEKPQLRSTKTAQFLRHTREKRRGTHCREESSLLNRLLISSLSELFFFFFFFAREQPFLGKRLNSLLEDPNATHTGEGLKLSFESDILKKPFSFLLTAAHKNLTVLICLAIQVSVSEVRASLLSHL